MKANLPKYRIMWAAPDLTRLYPYKYGPEWVRVIVKRAPRK